VQNISIWAAVIDVDWSAHDRPHTWLARAGYRRTAAIPDHVPDKLLPAGDCASALAILRRRRA
jgi:hypothetical protein